MTAFADSSGRANRWDEGFSQLVRYVERHGDARVPTSCVWKGYPLGKWVALQRNSYGNGTLTPEREHRLSCLPGWAWNRNADRWEDGFRHLLRYVERHGEARVRQSYTVDGYRLGVWVSTQRHNYAKGTLAADRQHRLEHLPGWTWNAHT